MWSGRPENNPQEKQQQKKSYKQQTVRREIYKTKDHKIKPKEKKKNIDLPHAENNSCTPVFEE